MVYRVLENSMDLVYSLGQRTAVERVAVFLLYLRNRNKVARNLADDSLELAQVALPMSRQDIADFLRAQERNGEPQLHPAGRAWPDLPSLITPGRLSMISPGLRKLAGIEDFSSPLRPGQER